MDADQLGIMQVLAGNIDLSENGQAMDAIREVGARAVGANRHFLECAHTNRNFETAFYRSTIADNNSYEQWEAEGAQDALKRANTLWKKMLSEYEAPPIDPGVDEALLEYIAKKKAAVPDSNV
jgi:trimethylamine--corrinoid protein Co-methyltransferase